MATREILALDAATPQILAPQTGDTYVANRAVAIAPQAGTSALTLTGGTITASAPLLDATQTWNDAAVTFTALRQNVTDTASAAGSLLADLQVGGTSRFRVAKGAGAFFDANAVEIRNGTAPQAFRVYNTFTDASNYERAKITWASNVLQIGTQNAGTGVARAVEIQTGGTTRVTIPTTGGMLVGDIIAGRGAGQIDTNTTFGREALQANTTGAQNIAVGRDALRSNTTGSNNTALGQASLRENTTGSGNSAMGSDALRTNTTGSNNSAVGLNALRDTTGSNNSAVGRDALRFNTTGSSNSAVGLQVLQNNTTGSNNSAVGVNALQFNSTGSNNSAVGREALRRISGSNNLAAGFEAGINISRGVATLGAIVGGSGYTDGTYNNVNLTRSSGSTFDGAPTANITVSGGAVTAVTLVTAGTGFQSTDTVLTAAASAIGGTGSGFTVAVSALTGAVSSDNTLLGYRAANNQTEGSRNIAIGANAQLDSLTGSDQINIGGVYFHDRLLYTERAADPAAPAANQAVVFARDDGNGKTQLCVRFATGAVQVLATEP